MEKLFIGIPVIMLIALALLLADGVTSSPTETRSGVVVDMSFTKGQTSTGVGTGMTSNGTIGTIVTTSSTQDEWVIMVMDSVGEIKEIECKSKDYYKIKEGNRVSYQPFVGGVFGLFWGYRLKR